MKNAGAELRRLALEQLARLETQERLRLELHERQRRVVASTSRFVALLCGRRSGKTELLSRLVAMALVASGHNEWVIFGARTRDIAKDLIWSHLVRINEEYKLGWSMRADLGTIRAPSGARFRVVGVDEKAEIQKVRGYKLRLAVFDEASTYDDHLAELIRECLSPALTDLSGRLVLSGTPGTVCAGYWHDASSGRLGYDVHHWTVRDNPCFPRDAEQMLAEERERFGWAEDDPTYRREYLGEWVEDASALVYAYLPTRNSAEQAPVPFHSKEWLTTLGCDYGYTDECGWVVLGSPRDSRTIYALHAERHSGMLPDEAARLTAELSVRFMPARIVGDGGGLGKTYVEEFNRRWAQRAGVTVHPAEKADKVGTIALLNGDLRNGEIVLLPGASELAYELQRLPWLDAKRTKEHPAYSNHAADAFLYAWKVHTSYWHKPRESEPVSVGPKELEALERRRRMLSAQKSNRKAWFDR